LNRITVMRTLKNPKFQVVPPERWRHAALLGCSKTLSIDEVENAIYGAPETV
jgi:hypothetical protein